MFLKYWTGRTLLEWTIYITKSHPALCHLCQFLSKSACSCCFFTRSLLSKVGHDRFDRVGDARSRVSLLHEMSVFDPVIRRGRSEKGWQLRALHSPWLVLDGMLVLAWVSRQVVPCVHCAEILQAANRTRMCSIPCAKIVATPTPLAERSLV